MKSNKKSFLGIVLLLFLQSFNVHADDKKPFYLKTIEEIAASFRSGASASIGLVGTLFATSYIQGKITLWNESALFPAIDIKYTGGLKNVYGADQAKHSLRILISQINNSDSFIKKGIPTVSGALLYGPPGTGKTLLARAVAEEVGCPFIYVTSSELSTPRLIQVLFENASRKARWAGEPCIIFIDEIDLVAAVRNNAVSWLTAALTNQLLAEMDGFQKSKERIIVIGATNNPQGLDSAMTRPGRLELLIEVPAFDAEARRGFLIACTELVKDLPFSAEFIEHAVQNTQGYGGAQLQSVIQGSARIAVAEGTSIVEVEHFEKYKQTSSIILDVTAEAQTALKPA